MIEQDTIKLLRECDAGIKMGITAIYDVLGYVRNEELRQEVDNLNNKLEAIRQILK